MSNLREPQYEEKRIEDDFFTKMGDVKKISSRGLYRDIEFLDNCKAACSGDVDCVAIGYDMASTVCVLYGEKRILRPPMWEVLNGVDGYPPLNGVIYLKVETAVERIPDNSLAVFIIGPPGITIVLTTLATLYGIRRWCHLRAKRRRKERRRFDRMLQTNSNKMAKLHKSATQKRADQQHGSYFRFGYGITWMPSLLKRQSEAIVKEDLGLEGDHLHQDIIHDDDDEFLKRLEHMSDIGEDPPGHVQEGDEEGEEVEEDEASETADPAVAPQLEEGNVIGATRESAPEQQTVG
jgi:hypothetical protein